MAHKTYVIGRGRRRNWRLMIAGLAALLFLAGGVAVYRQFQADTKPVIKNSAGSTHPMVIPNSKTQQFDNVVFSFEAPADWKLIRHDASAYDLYSYRATLTNADNRYLDIYMDKLPLNLAVNKAVAVRAQGNNLSHGQVSENCTTYTSPSASAAGGKPLAMPAKWDGVEFICDNDSVFRNVIGTSSPGTVNKVTLTGQTSGSHAFFFVFTDNNSTPDYSIFYRILESFTVK